MSSLDLTWAVRSVDSMLRRRQGIEEFTDDPECIFRISVTKANRTLMLSDGALIEAHDPIVEIHYWNEHMPPLPVDGLTPGWAAVFKRGVSHSLSLVADLLEQERRFADIAAIYATPAFSADAGGDVSTRITKRLGFDVVGEDRENGPIHAWFDSLLIWVLVRTYNPPSAQGRGIFHRRLQIWMSRNKLIERYGSSNRNREKRLH